MLAVGRSMLNYLKRMWWWLNDGSWYPFSRFLMSGSNYQVTLDHAKETESVEAHLTWHHHHPSSRLKWHAVARHSWAEGHADAPE